ncbi:MAG: DUF4440 domain-containing protein [Pikeienuella sp.]|uniref:DUF4440 domain-containing protein n=1 Tax=Pikeienuella sp. TaxID=2831957 RepID=UPI00391CAF30
MSGPTPEALLALEREVWEALRRGDAAADAALLSEDFVGVYPDGFAGRAAHAAQLSAGPSIARYEIGDARMIALGEGAALLSYEALYAKPGGADQRMFVSSLWALRDGRWLNIFSQDTPAA